MPLRFPLGPEFSFPQQQRPTSSPCEHSFSPQGCAPHLLQKKKRASELHSGKADRLRSSAARADRVLAVADVPLPARARHVAQPDDGPAAAPVGVPAPAVLEPEHRARLLRREVREPARADGAPGALEEHLQPAAVRRAVLQPHRGGAARRAHVPRRQPRLGGPRAAAGAEVAHDAGRAPGACARARGGASGLGAACRLAVRDLALRAGMWRSVP